jgi:tryptophan synthase alpha chain
MSERLQQVLQTPPQGLTRLITYTMAGDPDGETSLRRLKGLADSGVDILEFGVPFSDPMSDGPVIQAAAERALNGGMNLRQVLKLIRRFRQTHSTPVLLMTYFNPLLRYGWEKFVRDAVEAGVDGLILPELPYQEGKSLRRLTYELVGDKLTFIPMVAQTGEKEDIRALAGEKQGFAYVLSRNGITGGEVDILSRFLEFLQELRQEIQLPLCVGFGIQKNEQVQALAGHVDGVIVGSALVDRFHKLDKEELDPQTIKVREDEIYRWAASLKKG